MSVKLLNEHHLEFLSLKGGCTCSSESMFVKMPHCWESHITAHLLYQSLHYLPSLADMNSNYAGRSNEQEEVRYISVTKQPFSMCMYVIIEENRKPYNKCSFYKTMDESAVTHLRVFSRHYVR